MASSLLSPADPAALSPRRKSLVLAVSCVSMIVVAMDISIVNVALPAVGRDLHASEEGLQWTVDAYTLVLAGFLVLAGSVADRVGRRRVSQLGLAVFGLGSLLCGLAPSVGWLVAARALQAAGGTMLTPVAMAIVANTFTGAAERARAIGVFGSMAGLALALGPVLGGALASGLGWRSVFWVNVPVVTAAIVCTRLFVPESKAARARRFDPAGQALMVLALGSLVSAVIESRALGWTSPVIAGLLAAAALGLAGLAACEPRRADPLLELRLLRSVPFSAAIAMALFALCGFGAFLFVVTQYLQDVRGLAPATAGLYLLPAGLAILVVSPLAGRLVGARGPRLPLLAAGGALAAGGTVALWLGPVTPWPAVLVVALLFGVFLGAVNPPVSNAAISGMPRSMAGLAGSLASTGRQASTALGVAVAGAVIGPATARGGAVASGAAFTAAAHGVWWMTVALGAGITVLALVSTSRWAARTAATAAAVFATVDAPAEGRKERRSASSASPVPRPAALSGQRPARDGRGTR